MTERTIDPDELSPEMRALIADVKRAVDAFEREIGRLPEQDEVTKMAVIIARAHGCPEISFPPELRHH